MTSPFRYDMGANRSATKYSRKALAGRVLWAFAKPAFRFSPRLAWGWRNLLLRTFGAQVGHNVRVFPNVDIIIPWNLHLADNVTVGSKAILYALGPIRIGEASTVSQGAHLCAGTHDFRDPAMPLEKPPITIGQSVWICADAFVGPDVTIGDAAVVAARAVVVKPVDENEIVGGNPARLIGSR